MVILLGRLSIALIALLSLRIMTTLLEPAAYGLWALLVAFQSFCGLFLINPVGRHINRHTHAWWDEGSLLTRLKKFNRYIWIVSIFIFFLVTLWWHKGQENGFQNSRAIAAGLSVGLIVYTSTWNVTIVSLLNMLGFRMQSMIWMVISALLALAFSTLFVIQYTSPIAWIFGQALGFFIGTMGAWRVLERYSMEGPDFTRRLKFQDFIDIHTVIKFCGPLAAATGFMWLQSTGYRFKVGDIWGISELGILIIGLGVSAQISAIIESLAMQILNPYFYRRISKSKSDLESGMAFSDLLNVLTPVYAISAGLIALCAVILLKLLTDVQYHSAAPFVVYGAMIDFTRCLTNLWSNVAHVKIKTSNIVFPYVLGALVVWAGVIGAGYFEMELLEFPVFLVIAGAVSCVTMVFLMSRMLPVSFDFPRSIASIGIMVLCFLTVFMAPLNVDGIWYQLIVLMLCGITGCFLLWALLWRNIALKRLLSVSLRVVN